MEIFFAKNYLDPASRLGEILFGLIMVLTFTLIAGITIKDNPSSARLLLLSTLGCNIAWGVIDAMFYIMTVTLERGHRLQALIAIQNAPNDVAAMQIVADRLDDTLDALMTTSQKESIYQNIVKIAKQARPRTIFLTRGDILGALTSAWLVILSTFPAVIPFFFIQQAHLALRVSNFLLILLLFITGCFWAKYTHMHPFITGFVFMIVGMMLVGIAIALGG